MKALVLQAVRGAIAIEERPALRAAPGEVVVRMEAAALNRRDWWIWQGKYPGIRTPVVLGSDGAGIVIAAAAAGDGAGASWVGKEVIIDPGMDWGDDARAQGKGFHILGLPRDGTFAGEVAVPAAQVHAKPAHLDWAEAAALPLAGVTAYRAVFSRGRLEAGHTVLVTGIGGGVATFALQYAVAAGAAVWVTSSSPAKIARAVALGARGGFDYTRAGWSKDLSGAAGPVDLIVDGAGGAGYEDLIDAAAPGGRIVSYGATAGPAPKLDLFKVFWKQLALLGSTMGSPDDFAAMLRFVADRGIRPVVDAVAPLEDGAAAIERMGSSPQFGKCILRIR